MGCMSGQGDALSWPFAATEIFIRMIAKQFLKPDSQKEVN